MTKRIEHHEVMGKSCAFSLAENETIESVEENRVIKKRGDQRLEKYLKFAGRNGEFQRWTRWMLIGDVNQKIKAMTFKNPEHVMTLHVTKAVGRRDMNDLVSNLARYLTYNPERRERPKYVTNAKAKAILDAEIKVNPDMTDLDIFMFLYYRVFYKNYQATLLFLQAFLMWDNLEINEIRKHELSFYRDVFKNLVNHGRFHYVERAVEIIKEQGRALTFATLYETFRRLIRSEGGYHFSKKQNRVLYYVMHDYE